MEKPVGVIVEGPGMVKWSRLEDWAQEHSWNYYGFDFVTTELGEALARKRKAYFLAEQVVDPGVAERSLARAVVATPLGAVLQCKDDSSALLWRRPQRLELRARIPRDPLLPHVVGHVWWDGGQRENLHGLSGPGRWPLDRDGNGFEELIIYDRRAPLGSARVLSPLDVWNAQGRTKEEWQKLVDAMGDEKMAYHEGCRATGIQTAENLLVFAAVMVEEGQEKRAGAVKDGPKDESLAKLLIWLRQWKRGDYGTEGMERKAGGKDSLMVSRMGECLWMDTLEELYVEFDSGRVAGGRRSKKTTIAEAEANLVAIQVNDPFDGEVAGRVDEWLEANMTGDKAASTAKIYAGAWNKWKAWATRQGMISEYLPVSKEKIQENETRLLNYLGYLGWLSRPSSR